MGSITLNPGQSSVATFTFTGSDGNPYTPVNVPVSVSSDPSVATVEAAPDGLSAIVTAIAEGTVSVVCDEEGVEGVGSVTVVGIAPPPVTLEGISVDFGPAT